MTTGVAGWEEDSALALMIGRAPKRTGWPARRAHATATNRAAGATSVESGSQITRILTPIPGRSIGATVTLQGTRGSSCAPVVIASASIAKASGLSVQAFATCDGPHYTVNLEYSALPDVQAPSKGEEFVVSVKVTDSAGNYLNSFAAGVLFI